MTSPSWAVELDRYRAIPREPWRSTQVFDARALRPLLCEPLFRTKEPGLGLEIAPAGLGDLSLAEWLNEKLQDPLHSNASSFALPACGLSPPSSTSILTILDLTFGGTPLEKEWNHILRTGLSQAQLEQKKLEGLFTQAAELAKREKDFCIEVFRFVTPFQLDRQAITRDCPDGPGLFSSLDKYKYPTPEFKLGLKSLKERHALWEKDRNLLKARIESLGFDSFLQISTGEDLHQWFNSAPGGQASPKLSQFQSAALALIKEGGQFIHPPAKKDPITENEITQGKAPWHVPLIPLGSPRPPLLIEQKQVRVGPWIVSIDKSGTPWITKGEKQEPLCGHAPKKPERPVTLDEILRSLEHQCAVMIKAIAHTSRISTPEEVKTFLGAEEEWQRNVKALKTFPLPAIETAGTKNIKHIDVLKIFNSKKARNSSFEGCEDGRGDHPDTLDEEIEEAARRGDVELVAALFRRGFKIENLSLVRALINGVFHSQVEDPVQWLHDIGIDLNQLASPDQTGWKYLEDIVAGDRAYENWFSGEDHERNQFHIRRIESSLKRRPSP